MKIKTHEAARHRRRTVRSGHDAHRKYSEMRSRYRSGPSHRLVLQKLRLRTLGDWVCSLLPIFYGKLAKSQTTSRMTSRMMHLAAGKLQVDSASPAYPEVLGSTIQISTAPAMRMSSCRHPWGLGLIPPLGHLPPPSKTEQAGVRRRKDLGELTKTQDLWVTLTMQNCTWTVQFCPKEISEHHSKWH